MIILKNIKRKQEGVYAEDRKNRTQNKATEIANVPSELVFPLNMHIGKPAIPTVEVGDKVKIGTQIAEQEGMISANIHSSVSGEVIEIADHPTSKGIQPSVIIKNDYEDEQEEPLFTPGEKLSRQEKLDLIAKAGIVGMGGATFPTSVKLSATNTQEVDTILINGAECEPYATSDHRMMVEQAPELIKGIKELLEIFPVKQVYIGIEKNGIACEEILAKEIGSDDRIKVKILPTLYPQGSEKNLIKNITGREVPTGGLPLDIGAIVLNVGTTFAIYEAITFGKPLTKRITTVSGNAIKNPKNLWARIGTPFASLIDDCEGFQTDPGKMLHGGPMMGVPLTSGRVPVSKGATTITFLDKSESQDEERSPCIRCSECLYVCPVSLQPIMISNAYEEGDIDRAEELGALDCIDCGACTFTCPSKIPILENIQKAKVEINRRKRGA